MELYERTYVSFKRRTAEWLLFPFWLLFMGSEIHAGFIGEVPKAESQDLRSRKIPRLLACQTVQVPGPRIVSTRAPGVVPCSRRAEISGHMALPTFLGRLNGEIMTLSLGGEWRANRCQRRLVFIHSRHEETLPSFQFCAYERM